MVLSFKYCLLFCFFFQAEDGIRDADVTGVQTCALPIFTTALLPAVGLPVLAAAAELHDHPVARDLTFLAVVGTGVYARRWGPRGHSLGVRSEERRVGKECRARGGAWQ